MNPRFAADIDGGLPVLGEHAAGMRELGPPESDRPATLLGPARFDAPTTIRFGLSGLTMSTLALNAPTLGRGAARSNTNGVSG
jgi:hypothetical protein